jgi:hypothetical protein
LFKGSNGVDEGQPGEPLDVFDGVTAGAAAKAVETLGYAANRQ